jgi:hypothetical protein
MKYRAICPGCGIQFPRAFFFKWLPHVRRHCTACGCAYRVNSVWEWTANIIFGLLFAAFVLLAMFRFVSWKVAVVLILLDLVTAYALFPYITPFDLLEKRQKHDHTPSAS